MKRTIGELAPLEKEVQKDVIELFQSLGCHVVRTSPGRRGGTFQTPGIPDLLVFVPRKRCAFWWETKGPNGRQRPEQKTFQQLAEACGQVYRIGGMEAALIHLRTLGLITPGGPALLARRAFEKHVNKTIEDLRKRAARDESRR